MEEEAATLPAILHFFVRVILFCQGKNEEILKTDEHVCGNHVSTSTILWKFCRAALVRVATHCNGVKLSK